MTWQQALELIGLFMLTFFLGALWARVLYRDARAIRKITRKDRRRGKGWERVNEEFRRLVDQMTNLDK